MKAIMISVKPKWCAKIMNGEKTIEVRKNKALANAIQKLIDENGYADIYVYCSKDKQGIFKEKYNGYVLLNQNKWIHSELNGKVLFKFRCYKVEEIKFYNYDNIYETDNFTDKGLRTKSCLSWFELNEYLNKKLGYAIHISDLEIFDRPKELSEFYTVGYLEAFENSLKAKPFPISSQFIQNQYLLRKAPQNMVYIEIEDSTHI